MLNTYLSPGFSIFDLRSLIFDHLMELFFAHNFTPGIPEIHLSPDESRHAHKVLRKRPGDGIDLTDGRGHYIRGEIATLTGKSVVVRITGWEQLPFPAANHIRVALGIIRPNRLDWAVEKLTELGVERITPLLCRYTTLRTVKPDHLQRIAISAIKQSGQFYLPIIEQPISFIHWIKETSDFKGIRLIAQPEGNGLAEIRSSSPHVRQILLAIGPEGGFHPEEIELAVSKNFRTFHLGGTILRTETAAVAAVVRAKQLLSARI